MARSRSSNKQKKGVEPKEDPEQLALNTSRRTYLLEDRSTLQRDSGRWQSTSVVINSFYFLRGRKGTGSRLLAENKNKNE